MNEKTLERTLTLLTAIIDNFEGYRTNYYGYSKYMISPDIDILVGGFETELEDIIEELKKIQSSDLSI